MRTSTDYSADYDKVKLAILKRYELTSEAYRQTVPYIQA